MVFKNRINSKFFKRGKEEYAFSVDKKTLDRKIRLCTWRFNRNLLEFPRGIVINCWRKEVNQGGSAPFAIEDAGKFFRIFISIQGSSRFECRSLSLSKLRSKSTFQPQSQPSVQVYRTTCCITNYFTYPTFLCKIFIVKFSLLPRVREIKFWPWVEIS